MDKDLQRKLALARSIGEAAAREGVGYEKNPYSRAQGAERLAWSQAHNAYTTRSLRKQD